MLTVVTAVAGILVFLIALTGGVRLQVGSLRVSSTNMRNPLLLGGLAIAISMLVAPRGRRLLAWEAEWHWLGERLVAVIPVLLRRRITPTVVAIALAIGIGAIGLMRGAHVAAAADSYAYVSQARMFAAGRLTLEQPLIDDLPAGVPKEALVPLGYRLDPDRARLVPGYSPGLPLVMALFERIGGPDAGYVAMPLLAGLAIWFVYAVARPLTGDLWALVAAGFLAANTSFLLQLTHPPMSDIPAAAWWMCALWLVWRHDAPSGFGTGAATGLAVLTRPNLLPLAAVIAGIVAWRSLHASRVTSRLPLRNGILFALPVVVACGVIAFLNTRWYGSPFSSGYGQLAGELFRWEFFGTNVTQYGGWIFESAGPISLLGVLGTIALWRRTRQRPEGDARARLVAYLAFAIVGYGCYALYYPFNVWWYLRFLLPILPILFLLVAAGGRALVTCVPPGMRWAGVVVFLMAATVPIVAQIRARSPLDSRGERRYETAGRYVAERLPVNAAIIAVLHGGSVRHYSGKLTLRFDFVPAEFMDALLDHLRSRGYEPFFVIDEAEREQFAHEFDAIGLQDRLSPSEGGISNVRILRLR